MPYLSRQLMLRGIAFIGIVFLAPASLAAPVAIFDASGFAQAQTEPDEIIEPVSQSSVLSVPSSGTVHAIDAENSEATLSWSFVSGASSAKLATDLSASASPDC